MIIDSHVHLFPASVKESRAPWLAADPGFAALYTPERARIAAADDLIRSLDRSGIDMAIAMNFAWSSHDRCVETNTAMIDAVRRFPDRLVGCCMIYPPAGPAAAVELRRCADAGLRGVGELRPADQGYRLSDPDLMDPLIEIAQRHGMVWVSHASEPVGHAYPGKPGGNLADLYAFVLRYPEAKVVLAHWGGGMPFFALMPEVRAALANTAYDTAGTPYLYRNDIFRLTADLVGVENILFATDYPLMPQSRMLNLINTLELSPTDRALILGGNAARVWGLGG